MPDDLFDELRGNAQLASQTAQVVARLLEAGALNEIDVERMQPAIRSKQVELALLMDRLHIADPTDETDEMLRMAAQVERLWEDIWAKLTASPE